MLLPTRVPKCERENDKHAFETKENSQVCLDGPGQTRFFGNALKQKDKAPLFTLPNLKGKEVHLKELLAEGKLVLTFYGTGWSPYCCLELLAWEDLHKQLSKRNLKLVAISPERFNPAWMTGLNSNLTFEILVDVGNKIAKQFGLVSKATRPIAKELLESFCIDLISLNSGRDMELAIPATYLVDKDRTILHVFFDLGWCSQRDLGQILDCVDSQEITRRRNLERCTR